MVSTNLDYTALNNKVNNRWAFKAWFKWSETFADLFFLLPSITITLVGLVNLLHYEDQNLKSLATVMFLLVIGVILTWFFSKGIITSFFMVKRRMNLKEFAFANNFKYFDRTKWAFTGTLFRRGNIADKTYTDFALAGIYEGQNFTFGNHHFTARTPAGIHGFDYGFIRVILPKILPQIILRSKTNGMEITADLKKGQKLSLEGDFDKYFTLYVPKGYERDALYVLTPDLMALLIDNGNKYDVEIVGNELYFYRRPLQLAPGEIEELFEIINILGGATHKRTARYKDSQLLLGKGRGLLQSSLWQAVLLTIMVFILVLLRAYFRTR